MMFSLALKSLYSELKPERHSYKKNPIDAGSDDSRSFPFFVFFILQAFMVGVIQTIAHLAIEDYHWKPGYCSQVSAMDWTA